MKTIIILSICLPFYAQAQFGQIENGGFENWQTIVIANLPDQWNTDSESGLNGISQSNDAASGSHSLRLESFIGVNGDTLPSSVFLGSVVLGLEGIPYWSPFQQVGGYYKCNVAPGDSATIVVAKFFGGVSTFSILPFQGSESNWTYFSLPVSTGPTDSLFFGVSSGSPATSGNTSLGNWIMVDSIHLLHSGGSIPTTLPNYDFETWSIVEVEDPQEFSTLNEPLYAVDLPGVEKTTDASSGTFAVKLTTRAGYDPFRSYLSIGEFDFNGGDFLNYFDYNASPVSMEGMYKTSGGSIDTAYLFIEFAIGGTLLTQVYPFLPTTQYTPFSIPLNIPAGSSPDSALVVFYSGPVIGSSLYLDELAFEGGDVSIEEESPFEFRMYPNPVSDVLLVKSKHRERGELILTALDGKSVLVLPLSFEDSNELKVDVSALTNGVYICTIRIDDYSYSEQVIIQR